MSHDPRVRYTSAKDWRAVAEVLGREAAGLPPPGAERYTLEPLERRWRQHLPVGPTPFLSTSWQSDETREAEQRRQRVNALLEKHGLRKRPGW